MQHLCRRYTRQTRSPLNPCLAFLLISILILAVRQPCCAIDLNDGLVGYWSFDDGTATDHSGNGNDGAIHGAVPVAGVSGQALSFDGVDDYVRIPDSDELDFSGNMTITAWIFQVSEDHGYRIVDKQTAGGSDGYTFDTHNPDGYSDRRLRLCGGLGSTNADTVFSLHSWHHVVAVVSGSTVSFYLDGQFDGGGNLGGILPSNDFDVFIGKAHVGCGGACGLNESFHGFIDEVRIYNRALSDIEIQELYQMHSPPEVNNVTVSQRSDDSRFADIYYDLFDAGGDVCKVTVEVSDDGGSTYMVSATSFEGDIGPNIASGTGKHIIWNCKADLPGEVGSNYKIRIIADDGNQSVSD